MSIARLSRSTRLIAVVVLALLGGAGAIAASGGPPAVASPGAAQLPASHASAGVIQPQPAPGSCRARGTGELSLPDPRCTPGAIDPAVGQRNIAATICRVGYTRTVRPPERITASEKRASMLAYGDRKPTRDYEYDHLVPLELGGAPNDPRNLWPEPGSIPNPKDRLENRLHARVCAGQLRLSAAQRMIGADWTAAYRQAFG